MLGTRTNASRSTTADVPEMPTGRNAGVGLISRQAQPTALEKEKGTG